MSTTEKRCPRCLEVKSAAQFYVSKKRPDGLSSYCRTCQVADAKSRYVEHPRWKASEGSKYCPKCDTVKPLEQFGANRKNGDGKQNYCKPCCVASVTASRRRNPAAHRQASKAWRDANPGHHADLNARWRYGIEVGTYDRMLAQQQGLCAICGTDDPKPARRFHVDHCHETGVVRGLLCTNCNTGLGQFKHSIDLLSKAQKYLLLST